MPPVTKNSITESAGVFWNYYKLQILHPAIPLPGSHPGEQANLGINDIKGISPRVVCDSTSQIFVKDLFGFHVYLCVGMCTWVQVSQEGWRHQVSWSWSYGQLWAAHYGCWEPILRKSSLPIEPWLQLLLLRFEHVPEAPGEHVNHIPGSHPLLLIQENVHFYEVYSSQCLGNIDFVALRNYENWRFATWF